MTSIDIVVMAHPTREAQAEQLAAAVDASWITWDQANDEWDTGARAWDSHFIPVFSEPDPNQWAIVLQDDAIPVPNFRQHAADALAAAPERTAVSFYVGTGRPLASRVTSTVATARHHRASWIQSNRLLWGVALAIPNEHIRPLLNFAADSTLPYDQRISSYYRHRHQHVLYTWPSLVDHDDNQPSLVGHHSKPAVPRRAHLATEPARWTGPVITL